MRTRLVAVQRCLIPHSTVFRLSTSPWQGPKRSPSVSRSFGTPSSISALCTSRTQESQSHTLTGRSNRKAVIAALKDQIPKLFDLQVVDKMKLAMENKPFFTGYIVQRWETKLRLKPKMHVNNLILLTNMHLIGGRPKLEEDVWTKYIPHNHFHTHHRSMAAFPAPS